jgi:hypothetical protein
MSSNIIIMEYIVCDIKKLLSINNASVERGIFMGHVASDFCHTINNGKQ